MSRETKSDDAYLDLRAQHHADRSFMGGTSLSTRTIFFLFIGIVSMIAFAAMYIHVDQVLSKALESWKDAQRVSSNVTELSRTIDDVRVFDARVRNNGDPVAMQNHRRAIDRVVVLLDSLQRIPQSHAIRDAIITTRDAFANYGEEFAFIVDTAAKLGVTENSGLNGQRREIADNIRELIHNNGLDVLMNDFNVLDARPNSDPAPLKDEERAAIVASYNNISILLDRSNIDDDVRGEINQQLQRHAAVVAAILDIKATSDAEFPPFTDIVDYIGPSFRIIMDFNEENSHTTPISFNRVHDRVRQIIVIGSALILIILVLFGAIMLRSVTSPIKRLAESTLQLADGNRAISLPLRGNKDSIGDMARSLDIWLDHMAEVDHLHAELDDARMRLALGAIAETVEHPQVMDDKVVGGVQGPEFTKGLIEQSGTSNFENEITRKPVPKETASSIVLPDAGVPLSERLSSPIGDASKQLSQFSEFVAHAAMDVERTETLIQALSDTTRYLSELESCVTVIRDEANLLVFRGPNRGSPDDDQTLAYLPGGATENLPDSRRFNAIRQTVNRSERLIISARASLDTMNTVTQEIATAASSQALNATNKLLTQSEYLQNMLDDLVQKLGPVTGAEKEYAKEISHSTHKNDNEG